MMQNPGISITFCRNRKALILTFGFRGQKADFKYYPPKDFFDVFLQLPRQRKILLQSQIKTN